MCFFSKPRLQIHFFITDSLLFLVGRSSEKIQMSGVH